MMKYGLLFTDADFRRRKTVPNMDSLPKKCCANCDHWVECTKTDHSGEEVSKGYGGCVEHSTYDWDAFSWADDSCESHVKIEDAQ